MLFRVKEYEAEPVPYVTAFTYAQLYSTGPLDPATEPPSFQAMYGASDASEGAFFDVSIRATTPFVEIEIDAKPFTPSYYLQTVQFDPSTHLLCQ